MDHHQTGSNNWIWTPTPTTKRKLDCYESWEERAFAEDAAGVLGSSGCVWPPRSYTCSFCRREFKSAQALGGHMNVHRRDRARLKQLPNTPQDQPQINALSPTHNKCPSPNLSTFVYDASPNPNFSHTLLPSKEGSNGVGSYNSSKNSSFMQVCNFSSPSSSPNFRPNFGKRDAKIIELVDCRDDEIEGDNLKCANSELSISLNLVVRRNRPEEESSCFKRRKITPEGAPSTPLIFLSKSGEVDHNKSKVNVAPREIDLELRLGG